MMDDFNLQEILGWTRDLYNFGFKRPGTHEGHLAEEYLFGLLKGFGIPDVRAEEVSFLGWFHDRVFIAANSSSGSLSIPAEPIVYTGFTPPAGVTGEVVDLGSGTPEEFAGKDLSGKIALITYSHGYLPYDGRHRHN